MFGIKEINAYLCAINENEQDYKKTIQDSWWHGCSSGDTADSRYCDSQ